MAKIIITGGTGLIGQALTAALMGRGDEVVILTRDPDKHTAKPGLRFAAWDPARQWIDPSVWEGAVAVIHLAGASVADKRWTKARKKEIRNSRILGSQTLVKAISEQPNQVSTIISASGISWYGTDPQIPNPHPFREEDAASDDFLAQICVEWEQCLQPLQAKGIRVAYMRTGIVLSKNGGALKEFSRPLQWGIAAILGNGHQYLSWIHIDDMVRAYMYVLDHQQCEGAYNAAAPSPVAHQQFMLHLAQLKRGRFYIPVYVPAFLLRLIVGEMSVEVLRSTTVSCSKLHVDGFQFLYPAMEAALENLK